MNSALTSQDIQTIIEALDIWEGDEVRGTMFASVMASALIPTKAGRLAALDESKKDLDSAGKKSKLRKEQSTLIKAKLILLRQSMAADEAFAHAAATAGSGERGAGSGEGR